MRRLRGPRLPTKGNTGLYDPQCPLPWRPGQKVQSGFLVYGIWILQCEFPKPHLASSMNYVF